MSMTGPTGVEPHGFDAPVNDDFLVAFAVPSWLSKHSVLVKPAVPADLYQVTLAKSDQLVERSVTAVARNVRDVVAGDNHGLTLPGTGQVAWLPDRSRGQHGAVVPDGLVIDTKLRD